MLRSGAQIVTRWPTAPPPRLCYNLKPRGLPKTSRQGPGWRNPRGSQPGPDFARNSYPPGQPLKEETGTSAYRSVAGSTDLARTGPGQALVGETRMEANQGRNSPEPVQFRTARRMPGTETDQNGRGGETQALTTELRPPLGGLSSPGGPRGAADWSCPAVIVALHGRPL